MAEWQYSAAILIVGFIAGIINVNAGGGSLLTLPVLIFSGLDPIIANGTNRIAILSQNVIAIVGFKSKGLKPNRFSFICGGIALVGAIIGAWIASHIDATIFKRTAGILMIGVICTMVFNPFEKSRDMEPRLGRKHRMFSYGLFFFVGIYGGFIQAGTGFLILAVLVFVNRFSLLRANSSKVFIALIYTLSAILVFIINGQINWLIGCCLALGQAIGAWVGTQIAVYKGDKWIKGIMIILVICMALKLILT